MALCGRYVPAMVDRGRGAVLNVAHGGVPAAAAPGHLRRLQGLRPRLHRRAARRPDGTGVSATSLCPGPVKTEPAETAGINEASTGLPEMFWTDQPGCRGGDQGAGARPARRGAGQVQPGDGARRPARPGRGLLLRLGSRLTVGKEGLAAALPRPRRCSRRAAGATTTRRRRGPPPPPGHPAANRERTPGSRGARATPRWRRSRPASRPPGDRLLPDGRALITERPGRVRLLAGD